MTEDMITVAELTTALNLPVSAAEKVARFAGAYRPAAEYSQIGRPAPRWAGQGTAATFTRDEAEQIEAEWNRAKTHAETIEFFSPNDTEAQELADRYRAASKGK